MLSSGLDDRYDLQQHTSGRLSGCQDWVGLVESGRGWLNREWEGIEKKIAEKRDRSDEIRRGR